MNKKAKLIVSVDQVALLRTARRTSEPDPVHFALQAELAGALGIRAHLRIDRAGMTEQEMEQMNRMVKTRFYLQVSPHQDIVHLVNGLRPHNVILCAERREDRAVETGLDAALLSRELQGIIKNIDTRQTRVFLFVEPDLEQVKTAARLQVRGLLINVRDLMVNPLELPEQKRFEQLKETIRLSAKYGLETHLAGGVVAERIPDLMSLPGVRALHVGHQLVARSLQLGVLESVKSYLNLL